MTWQIQIYSILNIRILSHYFSYVKLATNHKIKQLSKVDPVLILLDAIYAVLFLQVLSEMSYKHVLKPLNKPAF